ncbi:MAG: DUF11 domain-containing protein, partial [Candidatus Firestonebacteria bacterium]|nr:DUF11 domain-containing protein [Candidatus Firestonebacteria bacterium]
TVATDLDGNSRIRGFAVDMGAYESPLLPCLHAAKQVTPTTNVPYGSVVTYTLVLSNSGALTDTATLTDALPAGVVFGGWVANPGATETAGAITWSGTITPATDTDAYYFDAAQAVNDLKPGAWAGLSYTARVHAENLVAHTCVGAGPALPAVFLAWVPTLSLGTSRLPEQDHRGRSSAHFSGIIDFSDGRSRNLKPA